VAHTAKWLGLVALLLVSATAAAQRAAAAVTGARSFAVEALGGTVGSALGIAIGLAVAKANDCPSGDDVACTLQKLGITGIIGVAGATIGTAVVGRWAGTNPSLVGAGTVVLFSVTQGILAAAGSRIGARLRRN
jgi:hypothetical protein